MDKIQELHYNEIGAGYIPEESEKAAAIHASITEDLIGKAMEWAWEKGWQYDKRVGAWWMPSKSDHTTTELIQLFKETL